MTVNQLTIFVSLSALEPLPEGEKRCRVPYEWSITGFGLNLAVFKPMLEVSELKTGPEVPVTCVDTPPQEEVGQQRKLGEEIKSMGDGDTVLVGDAPPWIRTHRVEPNLLPPEGKMKWVELSIGDWALSYLIFRWFKFTLKSPYTVVHGNLSSAIWDTSHWTSFVKFGLKTAWDISYDILWPILKYVNFWQLQGHSSNLSKKDAFRKLIFFLMKEWRGFDEAWGF